MTNADRASDAFTALVTAPGDIHAALPAVLEDLRRIAHREMKGQPRDHTLQTTALVNEAVLRLLASEKYRVNDQQHLLNLAARAMKQILIDHARAKDTLKRKPPGTRVTLDNAVVRDEPDCDIEGLASALDRLRAFDALAAQTVELRYFLELGFSQIAVVQNRSADEVRRDWRIARAWLRGEIQGES